MAQSRERLSRKNGKGIQKHDVLLLYHELTEIGFILQRYSQQEAHDLASKQYDYAKASNEYYKSLGF